MRHGRVAAFNGPALPIVQVSAILSVVLALVPAGAHFFELSNKLGLSAHDYVIVQQIYHGWSLFGFVIAAALITTAAHAYYVRSNKRSLSWSLAALAGIVLTQVLFWTLIYPINAVTQNWSVLPGDFESARLQWEYAHAACFVLNLAALVAMILSVQTSRPIFSVGIMDAIGENIRARIARARALGPPNAEPPDDHRAAASDHGARAQFNGAKSNAPESKAAA